MEEIEELKRENKQPDLKLGILLADLAYYNRMAKASFNNDRVKFYTLSLLKFALFEKD